MDGAPGRRGGRPAAVGRLALPRRLGRDLGAPRARAGRRRRPATRLGAGRRAPGRALSRRSPDFQDLVAGPVPSLLMGEAGILLVAHTLAPAAWQEERLLEAVRANAANPSLELMWGSPGTMIAARVMAERTGAEHWRQAWSESAERPVGAVARRSLAAGSLRQRRRVPRAGARLRRQRPRARPGRPARAGAPRRSSSGGRSPPLTAYAERDERPLPVAAESARRVPAATQPIRTQWCHGAPGMVASLAALAPHDEQLTELLLEGGELTWRAGPLTKGAGLCHGTAGNGYAFLKLFERTGDELWLDRARALRDARRRAGRAGPRRARSRPPHALDGRPRRRPLPAGLRHRDRRASRRSTTSETRQHLISRLILNESMLDYARDERSQLTASSGNRPTRRHSSSRKARSTSWCASSASRSFQTRSRDSGKCTACSPPAVAAREHLALARGESCRRCGSCDGRAALSGIPDREANQNPELPVEARNSTRESGSAAPNQVRRATRRRGSRARASARSRR